MPRAITLVLVSLVGMASATSCDSSIPASAQTSRASTLAHELALQGVVSRADGKPLTQSQVSLKITADGLNLFVNPDGSCSTDPHMQGGATLSAQTDDQGKYTLSVPLTHLVSGANSSCPLQRALGQLTGLALEASVSADQPGCVAYCQGTAPTHAAGCMSSCLEGDRRITGTQKLTQDRLVALDTGASNDVAALPMDFKLSKLGPPISTHHGPDLVVDGAAAEASAHVTTETFSATDCAVVEHCLSGPGTHRLLRFDGTIRNLGDADFVLGAPENNPLFMYSACHNHYHLKDIMLYELLTSGTRQPVKVGASNVVGRKQGFCMEDMQQIASDSPGKFDCENQGVTAGWADVYDSSLDCQWIDVTGVPAGNYILRITVNPAGLYSESDTTNDASEAKVVIPQG